MNHINIHTKDQWSYQEYHKCIDGSLEIKNISNHCSRKKIKDRRMKSLMHSILSFAGNAINPIQYPLVEEIGHSEIDAISAGVII
jgi:hypothetical protein